MLLLAVAAPAAPTIATRQTPADAATVDLTPDEPRHDASPYEVAREVGHWLSSNAVETDTGLVWPVDVDRRAGESDPLRPDLSLYSGSPGVVLFFLELAYATRADPDHAADLDRLMNYARAGADALIAECDRRSSGTDLPPLGLYTGLAGLGFTFTEVWKATNDAKVRSAAERCVDRLLTRAEAQGEPDGAGESGRAPGARVRFGPSTDIISGDAGIGLFLLYAARELSRPDALACAIRVGNHLVTVAIPVETEAPDVSAAKWAMTPAYERRMPNYSHGTAGVGHLFAELVRVTGSETFLESARAASAYLELIATPQPGGGSLVFHHEPGGEDLFYLSWCHGPPGTVRFLSALAAVSNTPRTVALSERLVLGLEQSGVPERSAGFWNNAGVCCGTAGVADLFLALDASEATVSSAPRAELVGSLLHDILRRATSDESGARWTHAEHRTRPEQLSTQTGFMQGAAGIGMILLRFHARETGGVATVRFPDEPWG